MESVSLRKHKNKRKKQGTNKCSQKKRKKKDVELKSLDLDIPVKRRNQGKSVSLVDKLRRKLDGSQFRCLNEELYTSDSKDAFNMIQGNTGLFDVYHKGFKAQVQRWPTNPVHLIINVSSPPTHSLFHVVL